MKRYKIISDIFEERLRQESKGFTTEHDNQNHDGGDLAALASCYTSSAACELNPYYGLALTEDELHITPDFDNFGWHYNPKGYKQDLIRAAALIIAELEMLDD